MTKKELLRQLRKNGDTSVLEELRNNGWLSANSNRTFGVEIECVFPSSDELYAFVADVNDNTDQHVEIEGYNHRDSASKWKIVTDSSLRASAIGSVPREIVSPILKGHSGKKALKQICKKLSEHGVRVNRSCGLHVHFGAKDFKLADFKKIVLLYMEHETEIDRLLARSRRGEHNSYCRGLSYVNRDRVLSAPSVRALNTIIGGRYHKLNLAAYVRHGTIEFRQHQGTINYTKISRWIDLGMCMMRWAKYSKVPVESSLFDGCELSASAITFWQHRMSELSA